MNKEKPKKRISIEVDDAFLLELKKRALFRNMTMKRYVIALINEQFIKEKKYE